MAEPVTKTSFKQFEYCSFCMLSHRKGRKHIYSKRHQNVIKNILTKFYKKIEETCHTLDSAKIESPLFELNKKFWCYMCTKEEEKHEHNDDYTVVFGKMIEHLASTKHRVYCYSFFREHRVDETKHSADQYCISQTQLDKYEENKRKQIFDFLKKQDEEKSKLAWMIKQKESKQQRLLSEALKTNSKTRPQQLAEQVRQQNVEASTHVLSTALASGEGAKFIGSQEFNPAEGNVHTGGLAPWLYQEEGSGETTGVIGPTIETLNEHTAQQKKKKLPAERVGAKKDRSSMMASDWLPSFGRVWNTGRRLNSRTYFQKHEKQMSQVHSASTVQHKSFHMHKPNHLSHTSASSTSFSPAQNPGLCDKRFYTSSTAPLAVGIPQSFAKTLVDDSRNKYRKPSAALGSESQANNEPASSGPTFHPHQHMNGHHVAAVETESSLTSGVHVTSYHYKDEDLNARKHDRSGNSVDGGFGTGAGHLRISDASDFGVKNSFDANGQAIVVRPYVRKRKHVTS